MEATNLSKIKRDEMIEFLEHLKKKNKDDKSIIAINEIVNRLNSVKYGLVWEQHQERVDFELDKNIPIFSEIEDKKLKNNIAFEYNFLLEGDNLHSLYLLEKTHRGKIGCIYIDPPYNRGKNDFVYNDVFISSEDGYKHSKWLSFMARRLQIARKLLSDNGLIFISIDDYEYAQLKLLCDFIFGEANFINMFIWQRNSSGKTEKDKFTVNTEYVLLYAKSEKYKLNPAYKPLSDGTKAMYNKNDNDGRGYYRLYPLQKPGNPGPETTYDYIDNTGKIWPCPAKGWRIKQSKLKALENDGRLYFGGKSLSEKAYWNERESEGKRVDTLWNDLPENSSASKELENIFNKKGVFDNPKPTELIKRCIQIAPKDSIVLDFFAGSGTTGQAVLELNKEDDGNRRFILCTNNENNICEEVTYQRLKTIITGIRNDGTIYSDEMCSNLKYYRTDWTPRKPEDYLLSNILLLHIKEMIELQNAIEIDNEENIIIFNKDDYKKYILNEEIYSKVKNIWVNQNIVFTADELKKLSRKKFKYIPQEFFGQELKEAAE